MIVELSPNHKTATPTETNNQRGLQTIELSLCNTNDVAGFRYPSQVLANAFHALFSLLTFVVIFIAFCVLVYTI